MTRDEIIVEFARLRARGHDARDELLACVADLPSRQRAAFRQNVQAVAKLYASVRPAPKRQPERPPVKERTSRLTKRERTAWRRYAKEFSMRLSVHARLLQ